MPKPSPPPALPGGWLVGACALAIATFFLVKLGARPPQVMPADGPAAAFSGARARAALERWAPVGPHPVTSAANAEVRDRIRTEFDALGLRTEIQSSYVCNEHGVCGQVDNLFARFPGALDPTDSAQPEGVLLLAHYDSVPAGPGIGDDLSGVACQLEIARALVADGDLERRRVAFLVTDGEEIGLLGAHAFVKSHPWFAEVDVVLNMEARGSSGPSLLFETGADSAWLMELYGRHAPTPKATSFSTELYRRMPNDTDFSPFRARGIAGANFAFIEDFHNYHTANDSLAQLDPRSLQHHGDNVLSLVRAICHSPRSARASGDLVYFDVLGRVLVRWPASWNVWIVALQAALLVVGLTGAARRGELRPVRVLLAAIAALVVWFSIGFAGAKVGTLLGLRPGPIGALHPLPVWLACLGLALLSLVATGALARSSLTLLFGLAFVVLGGAIATTWQAPGAAHLFLVPLAPLAVGLSLPALRRRASSQVLALIATFSSVLLWSPLVQGLGDAFGMGSGGPIAATMAASALWLAPIASAVGPTSRRFLAAAAGLLLVGGATVSLTQERVSPSVPGHVTFNHVVDVAGDDAAILADTDGHGLPAALQELFAQGPARLYAAWPELHSIPAAVLAESGPEMELMAIEKTDDGRALHIVLRSPGGAARTHVEMSGARLLETSIVGPEGTGPVGPVPVGRLLLVGVPPEGIELVLRFRSEAPIELRLTDEYSRASTDVKRLRDLCGDGYVARRFGDRLSCTVKYQIP